MFILQETLCKNKLFFFQIVNSWKDVRYDLEWVEVVNLLRAFREKRFFFPRFFITSEKMSDRKIFRLFFFLKHFVGACVYLNTLPAMLWWCTRLVYMTNKNIRDKILCCFMESPLSFSLKPFYSNYVHMWSYFCLLMLDSVFILLSDSIKIS